MPTASIVTNWLQGVLGGERQGSSLFEPQRMNSGLLYIVGLDGYGDSTGNGEPLRLAIANFSLPKVQTQETVIPYLNEFRKFAGATMYEGIQASFHDYVDRKTLSILWNWKLAVQDPRTGKKGYKSAYAKDGWIEMMPPAGEVAGTPGSPVKYVVKSMWPSMLDPGDVDMGSDEPVRINVQFTIDKAFPDVLAGLTPARQ